MNDLIQRLRDWDTGDDHTGQQLLMEAADALERLTRERDEARATAGRAWDRCAERRDEGDRLRAEAAELQNENDALREVVRETTAACDSLRDKAEDYRALPAEVLDAVPGCESAEYWAALEKRAREALKGAG
jgi:hypothetical protein